MKNIQEAWDIISPSFGLKEFIAYNPIDSFTSLPFEKALAQSPKFFQNSDFKVLKDANRESIKWLQQFFNERPFIQMPLKDRGLYVAWKNVARFDSYFGKYALDLPNNSEAATKKAITHLKIEKEDELNFKKILLTSLSGWASYMKHLSKETPALLDDFLGLRASICASLGIDFKPILANFKNSDNKNEMLKIIEDNEQIYEKDLINKIKNSKQPKEQTIDAQFIMCMDPRSESIIRELQKGPYQTFSCPGFFGLPLKYQNKSLAPIIIKPEYKIKNNQKENIFARVYQGLKYSFTTSFVLAESVGIINSIWMLARSFSPKLVNKFTENYYNEKLIYNISSECFAEKITPLFKTMGMVNFAEQVFICGHGSQTENNPYASALDCGACGGNNGYVNARVFCEVLNRKDIRKILKSKSINIPEKTIFIPMLHNTTTNQLQLLAESKFKKEIANLNKALYRKENIQKSINWSETRPEWGLAGNVSLVIGSSIIKDIEYDGRSFFLTYDYTQDREAKNLADLLSGPAFIAYLINHQYLFSSLDNISFGGGDKVTQNIFGQDGAMQGNASDIMHGLPLQSLAISHDQLYHTPQRLFLAIQAPKHTVDEALNLAPKFKQLVENKWVHLLYIDPKNLKIEKVKKDP